MGLFIKTTGDLIASIESAKETGDYSEALKIVKDHQKNELQVDHDLILLKDKIVSLRKPLEELRNELWRLKELSKKSKVDDSSKSSVLELAEKCEEIILNIQIIISRLIRDKKLIL